MRVSSCHRVRAEQIRPRPTRWLLGSDAHKTPLTISSCLLEAATVVIDVTASDPAMPSSTEAIDGRFCADERITGFFLS
jgi:hypothetical protein